MSSYEHARRAVAKIVFDGEDITDDVRPYLKSMTYTDNEDGEADDLQIKLQDREGIWLTKWLNNMIVEDSSTGLMKASDSYAGNKATISHYCNTTYGLNIRTGDGTWYPTFADYPYNGNAEVYCVVGSWAAVNYKGTLGFCWYSYLTPYGNAAPYAYTQALGSEGDQVWWIQKMLKELGYNLGNSGSNNDGLDAVFGSYTQDAVGQFQANEGIDVTYVCDAITWGHLYHAWGKATYPDAYKTGGADAAYKGLSIQADIVIENWKGDGVDCGLYCGRFELDSLTASGPPAEITIKATSLPYNSALRKTEDSKTWENISLWWIASEIAASGGMTLQWLIGEDPYYESVEQTKQSGVSFLAELCKKEGLALKIHDNSLVIFNQWSVDYVTTPVRTIVYGDGTYEKWNLSTSENDCKYDSCEITYVDPNTQNLIQGHAYADDYDSESDDHHVLRLWQKVNSAREADTLATRLLRQHNKYEYTVKFTVPGDPALCAGETVRLKGWGAFSGNYIISQAKHSVGDSGYTTQIQLRRVAA